MGRFGIGLNINDDGVRNTFLLSDANISYAGKRHLFEFSNVLYYNKNDKNNNSNRFFSNFRGALNRHHFADDGVINEAHFFPETNLTIGYDQGRGLNYRVNATAGITYSLHNAKNYRLRIGSGIMYEKESWRIFSKEFLPTLDSLPPFVKDLLMSRYGINSKGNIEKDNFRWSNYLQGSLKVGKIVNMTLLGIVQLPFHAPFNNESNLPEFPVGNKRYPRITVDANIAVTLSNHINFFTKYFIQKDKGQISPFAKKTVSNLSQGISYRF